MNVMKGFQQEWALASYNRQERLFNSLRHESSDSDEISSDVIITLANNIVNSYEKNNIDTNSIIQLSENLIKNNSLSVISFEQMNFLQILVSIFQNSNEENLLHAVLRIFIVWTHKWEQKVGILTKEEFSVYLTQFIFINNTPISCIYLSLNLLNRLLIIQPLLKIKLIEELDIFKNLVSLFANCDNEKLRDEILLCIWSLLHTIPHPDYEHISSVTDLFIDLFSDPSAPNFEKRVYIASVFAECSENCAFVLCELFSPAEILPNFETYSDEVKISILDLINTILLTDDTCTSMSVISGLTLDFFGGVADSENEDLILSSVRMLCALLRNEECTHELIQSALDDGVMEQLFIWYDNGTFQLKRYSAIALLQALSFQTQYVFHPFIVDKGFFELMVNFLDLGSQIVTKEVLHAILMIDNYCSVKQPSISELINSLNLKKEALGIDPFDPSDLANLDTIREGLMILNDEPLSF